MVDISTLSELLVAFSVLFGVVTWYLQNKENKEINQARLFMDLYQTYRSREFRIQYGELLYDQEWTDYDDWYEKYGPETNLEAIATWNAILAYFEGVGQLMRRKMIDKDLVYDLLSIIAITIWEKMEPTVKGQRERKNNPRIFDDFEYLYNEMKNYEQ